MATFVSKPRSTSRRHGSLDLGKERQMRSNVTERSSFCAHPMSRPHACAARNQAHLGWTDYVSRVLRCAAPCARRASTAQKARSRRDLQSLPRNLVLKASFACTRCRAGARARGARNHAHLGWTDYVNRVPRCAIPFAFRTWTAQIARSRRDLESLPRKLGLKPSAVRSPCRAAGCARRDSMPT